MIEEVPARAFVRSAPPPPAPGAPPPPAPSVRPDASNPLDDPRLAAKLLLTPLDPDGGDDRG
jgi:hypothetical protein